MWIKWYINALCNIIINLDFQYNHCRALLANKITNRMNFLFTQKPNNYTVVAAKLELAVAAALG